MRIEELGDIMALHRKCIEIHHSKPPAGLNWHLEHVLLDGLLHIFTLYSISYPKVYSSSPAFSSWMKLVKASVAGSASLRAGDPPRGAVEWRSQHGFTTGVEIGL